MNIQIKIIEIWQNKIWFNNSVECRSLCAGFENNFQTWGRMRGEENLLEQKPEQGPAQGGAVTLHGLVANFYASRQKIPAVRVA